MKIREEYVVEYRVRDGVVKLKLKLPPAPNKNSRVKIQSSDVVEYLQEVKDVRIRDWIAIASISNVIEEGSAGEWVAFVEPKVMAPVLPSPVPVVIQEVESQPKKNKRNNDYQGK